MARLQHVVERGDVIDSTLHRTLIAQNLNRIIEGSSNAVGSFTLTASVGTTTVTDNNFQSTMVPIFIPTTANAAAEIGNGTIYVSARADGSFTLTHANNAQTDRDFIYVRIG